MPVSGYVVHYEGDRLDAVIAALEAMPEVTVGTPESHGLPIATDTATNDESERLGKRLESIEGVTTVTLVYHNYEDTLQSS